jgi:hypothetical protein
VIDGRLLSLDRLQRHRVLLERAFARFRDDTRAFESIFAERNSTAEAVGSPLFGFAVDPVPGPPPTTSSSTMGRSSSTSCTYVNPTSGPIRGGTAAWC